MGETSKPAAAEATDPPAGTVDETVFRDLISRRFRRLLELSLYLQEQPLGSEILTRPLLGALFSEAAQAEELLDAYKARNNTRWFALRELISAAKCFSDINYKLLHIRHATPGYQLMSVEGDFVQDTEDALVFAGNVILLTGTHLVRLARERGLTMPVSVPRYKEFAEQLPDGYLPRDRERREVSSARGIVTELATAFLHQAASADVLRAPAKAKSHAECVPDPINEKQLRHLEEEFHNLQSRYDTYVSDTDTEELDGDLRVLRGHISVIYHLLQTATLMAHYYERHVANSSRETTAISRPHINPHALLETLMDYSVTYSVRYLGRARELCHRMLKRYASIGRIQVPVPQYRGFHVRPSTLVARIVQHYGSDVTMELGGERFDASAPLDLFRANEKINAAKRRRLAQELERIMPETGCEKVQEAERCVRELLNQLAEEQKVVIYERPLPLGDCDASGASSVAQCAVDAVARLLATGRIDICSEIETVFEGDERVLDDIRLLAENGYGEDAYGNNIALPAQLSYLRR